jgi:hypothetical protein
MLESKLVNIVYILMYKLLLKLTDVSCKPTLILTPLFDNEILIYLEGQTKITPWPFVS